MAQVDPHSQPNSEREAEERFLDRLEELGLLVTRGVRPEERRKNPLRRPAKIPGPIASEIIIRERR